MRKGELKRLLSTLGEPLNDEEMEDFLSQAITNEDGTVSVRGYCDKMIGRTKRRLSLFGQARNNTEA